MNTANQHQNTAQWYTDRLHHFTSSELHKLLTRARSGDVSKSAESYILDKLAEELTNGTCLDYKDIKTKEMQWGHHYEPVARELYETRAGVNVDLCGFIEWSEFFGGSPDGLVGENGIIEIKCPYNSSIHAKYLLVDNAETLKAANMDYYIQIQGNLLVTGREWCDFISYDPRCQNPLFQLKVLRVERDEEMIARIREAVTAAHEAKKRLMSKMVNLCMN